MLLDPDLAQDVSTKYFLRAKPSLINSIFILTPMHVKILRAIFKITIDNYNNLCTRFFFSKGRLITQAVYLEILNGNVFMAYLFSNIFELLCNNVISICLYMIFFFYIDYVDLYGITV